MNSMPQQAVANGNGQSELLRAQDTISSSFVTRNSPSPVAPAGGCAGRVLFFEKRAIGAGFYCMPETSGRGAVSDGARIALRPSRSGPVGPPRRPRRGARGQGL